MGIPTHLKKISVSFLATSVIFLGLGQANLISEAKALSLPAEPNGETPLIIHYRDYSGRNKMMERYHQRGVNYLSQIDSLQADIVRAKAGEYQKIMEEYKKEPDIAYVEPDIKMQAYKITNDPSLSSQWGMYKIDAANESSQSAWDITGGKNVKIAVVDSGIDTTHPDLAGKVIASKNFVSSATSAEDDNGHGTHVAGIIAADSDNGVGVAGVAYNASLLNAKVLDKDGNGDASAIANGITWAADNGAQVINLSLGSPEQSQTLEDAINYAWSKGAVIVAAAGNDSSTTLSYPAAYPHVISVAATDSSDKMADFSTHGSWVDVAAPGVSIYSTYKGGAYENLSGTSMASPYVAGLAGLVWSTGSYPTNESVKTQIENTADKIDGTGIDWTNGRVNAYSAVGGVVPAPISNLQ